MKQKDKELLIKDLCARIQYEVKVNINPKYLSEGLIKSGYNNPLVVYGITADGSMSFTLDKFLMEYSMPISSINPYLFPFSSMTKEQSKIYHELIRGMFGTSVLINLETLIDWLHTNHFDYRGLIGKGLAIDATNLNIY